MTFDDVKGKVFLHDRFVFFLVTIINTFINDIFSQVIISLPSLPHLTRSRIQSRLKKPWKTSNPNSNAESFYKLPAPVFSIHSFIQTSKHLKSHKEKLRSLSEFKNTYEYPRLSPLTQWRTLE